MKKRRRGSHKTIGGPRQIETIFFLFLLLPSLFCVRLPVVRWLLLLLLLLLLLVVLCFAFLNTHIIPMPPRLYASSPLRVPGVLPPREIGSAAVLKINNVQVAESAKTERDNKSTLK